LTGLAGIARRKIHPRIMRKGGDFVECLSDLAQLATLDENRKQE
jgi:hypothetical protein